MNTDRFKNEYPGLSTISIIFRVIGIGLELTCERAMANKDGLTHF